MPEDMTRSCCADARTEEERPPERKPWVLEHKNMGGKGPFQGLNVDVIAHASKYHHPDETFYADEWGANAPTRPSSFEEIVDESGPRARKHLVF